MDYAKLNSRSPTGKSGIRRAGTLGSGRGGSKKGRWRQRVKWAIRLLMVFLLVYWFGRTAYQLTFFVKAGMMRYWYHPLMKQRPIPCGTDTPPSTSCSRRSPPRRLETVAGRLGPSDDKDDDEDGAIFARRWNRRGKGGRAESWTEIISAVGCDVAGNRRRRRSGNAREWVGGSGGCRIIVVNEGV